MATRRAFLGVLGVGVMGARAQGRVMPVAQGGGQPDVPVRKVKTTALFKSPEEYPNAIAVAPTGCGSPNRRPTTPISSTGTAKY